MKLDTAYEVTDLRSGGRLSGVAILEQRPGGLQVRTWNGSGEFFPLGEDGILEDKEQEHTVSIFTPDGDVVFSELTLALFRDLIEPFVEAGREFQNDEEVGTYYFQLCQQADQG